MKFRELQKLRDTAMVRGVFDRDISATEFRIVGEVPATISRASPSIHACYDIIEQRHRWNEKRKQNAQGFYRAVVAYQDSQ